MVRRIWFLLALGILALDAGMLLAQEPDPYLVDGTQFGRWKLGVSEQDLLRSFREISGNQFRMAPTTSLEGGKFYIWDNAGFQFNAFQGKVVAVAVWRRRTRADVELIKYRTKEDIRIGEPQGKVLAAYGAPDRQWNDRFGGPSTYLVMVWAKRGLFIGFQGSIVEVLALYDPALPWSWNQ